ncbi:response regulator [Patescibacteria group bacterium]|nr:response regulator [Patescibacteria group bacterium]MBU2219612.1 response regulator [Patescibacteria group bacterium]
MPDEKNKTPNGVNQKILLIEDDKFLRDLIAKKLVAENYEVIEALDGESGIIKTKESAPSLILLDLILPGLDGFDVLAKIKADPTTQKIPVIVLSNLSQQEEVERVLNLGAVDFLIKAHLTPNEIIAKIKLLLK